MKLNKRIGKVSELILRILDHPVLGLGLVLVLAGYFVWLAFANEISWGGGDAIVHYRMARYSWNHPQLFLDMWGKPLLTTLSSPFAQLGFNYMKLFNVMMFVATSVVGFIECKKLNLKFRSLYSVFLFSAPIYFIVVPSTLTEPLFGLMLLSGSFLFLKQYYVASIIIISFLPFSRNEGIIFFPLYIIALMFVKQWKIIPFIFVGHIFFGLIGWLTSGNILWILDQMPYLQGGHKVYVYESGDLLHYPLLLPKLYGKYLLNTGIIGILVLLTQVLWKRKEEEVLISLIILLPILTYISAHSWVYWKGVGGAAGLHRIMAPIVPLLGIIALYGLSVVYNFLSHKILKFGLITVVIATTLVSYSLPIKEYYLPLPEGPHEKVISEAVDWMEGSDLLIERIYYNHPYVIHKLDIDPYNFDIIREGLVSSDSSYAEFPHNALLIWDSHFSPHEGLTPLGKILSAPNIKLLKSFPDTFHEWNIDSFMIHIFQKDTTFSIHESASLENDPIMIHDGIKATSKTRIV